MDFRPNSVPDARPPAAEDVVRWIVVPAWRWRAWVHPIAWISTISMVVASVLLVAACGGAIAAVHFAVGATDASTEGWQWRMAGAIAVDVLLLAAAAAAIAFLVRRLNGMTARALVASVQAADPAAGLIRADMLEAGPPREGWGRARTSRWLDEVTKTSGVRVFVSASLAPRVEHYERTDRAVEPERIGGATANGDAAAIMVSLGLGTFLAWSGGRITLVSGFLFASAVFVLVRMARRRTLFAPVVAGQGWIEHGTARWTAADSVLTASGGAKARVTIIGPPGVLTLRLRSARHADLEALWMRWLHPAPDLRQRAFDA